MFLYNLIRKMHHVQKLIRTNSWILKHFQNGLIEPLYSFVLIIYPVSSLKALAFLGTAALNRRTAWKFVNQEKGERSSQDIGPLLQNK